MAAAAVERLRDQAQVLDERCERIANLHADVAQARILALGCRRRASGAAGPPDEPRRYLHSAGDFRLLKSPTSGLALVAPKTAVTSSWDGWLRSFDCNTGKDIAALDVRHGPLDTVTASRGPGLNQLVGAGAHDGTAVVWNMEAGSFQELHGHRAGSAVTAFDFHPTSAGTACTGAADRTAILWNAARGVPVRTLAQHSRPVSSVRFLGTGRSTAAAPSSAASGCAHQQVLATACTDRHIRLWDTRAVGVQRSLECPCSRRVLLEHDPHGQLLLAASDAGTLAAWDLRTMRQLRIFDLVTEAGLCGDPTSVAFSNCYQYLALGASEGGLIVIDMAHPMGRDYLCDVKLCSGELFRCGACPHSDAIYGLSWVEVARGPTLLSASLDGSCGAWSLQPAAAQECAPPKAAPKQRAAPGASTTPGAVAGPMKGAPVVPGGMRYADKRRIFAGDEADGARW